jgi:peptidoglycan-associated lipoprotein
MNKETAMNFISRLGVIAAMVALVAACATTQEEATPDTADDMQRVTDPRDPRTGIEAIGAPDDTRFTGSPLDDPSSLLSKRVIYFDFDRAEIKPEFRDIVRAHAEYLTANSRTRVVLEGHTDERGTREYNMGLGERRANAVRSMLTLQGVASNQIESVSYGEERPVALGHDEESWRLNRRVEIVYR